MWGMLETIKTMYMLGVYVKTRNVQMNILLAKESRAKAVSVNLLHLATE